MILYFPKAYPDELLYSQLARYYIKSGYTAYRFAAEALYKNKTIKPNIEFINAFTEEALQAITNGTTFEEVILTHTMFPYYARFLNCEWRNQALKAVSEMRNDYYNLLCFPKNKNAVIRYLRYCPVCAKADRQQYGEAYWHRQHQMINVDICPLHYCRLINSEIPINSQASPSLITAEESIRDDAEIVISDNEIECKLAQYIAVVFSSPVDMISTARIGDYLHSKMANTKYLSLRGQQRNITALFTDYSAYYKNLLNNTLFEQWQLQKIFTNDRFGTYEICLLAMFLNIFPDELIHMELPRKRQQDIFDTEIKRLHKQGLNYAEIARCLNASYDVVKSIGEGRYGKYHYLSENPQKGGAKKKDWESIDAERLSTVINCIKELQNSDKRPIKISVGLIERLLGYPKKSLYNCPKCMAAIQKNYESQEEYWAREIIWAANQITSQNIPLTFTNIQKITNIRKRNLIVCFPYIKQYSLSTPLENALYSWERNMLQAK
ncbi:MAG: hypothetical protein E7602_02065 [Ruminococcaceae bacterium]|nr:hypothetical protein [Oscillospiraceae bacterium]